NQRTNTAFLPSAPRVHTIRVKLGYPYSEKLGWLHALFGLENARKYRDVCRSVGVPTPPWRRFSRQRLGFWLGRDVQGSTRTASPSWQACRSAHCTAISPISRRSCSRWRGVS